MELQSKGRGRGGYKPQTHEDDNTIALANKDACSICNFMESLQNIYLCAKDTGFAWTSTENDDVQDGAKLT
jgi:hypothetical protein